MSWILVVIALYADSPMVWPGATEVLIHRASHFETHAQCAAARRQLWRVRDTNVIKATCVRVQVPKGGPE